MLIVEKLKNWKQLENYKKSHTSPSVNTVSILAYFQDLTFFHIIFPDGLIPWIVTAKAYIMLIVCQAQFQVLHMYYIYSSWLPSEEGAAVHVP